jgi:hypothetical protein
MSYIFIIIVVFKQVLTISNIHNIYKEIKANPFDESQVEMGRNKNVIKEIENTILVSPKMNGCNIKFDEKTSFTFENQTEIIHYTIISKRLSLNSFIPYISEEDNNKTSITSFNLYKDKSNRQRTVINEEKDDSKNSIKFRDRWVVEVNLSKPVLRVSINFSYYGERAILINTKSNSNILNLSLFNPYSESFPYKINLLLVDFDNFNTENIFLPENSLLKQRSNKINEIQMHRYFDSHSEYDFTLTFPLEINSCDGNFLNMMYYGLIGMTSVFAIISVAIVIYMSKE